MTENEISRLIVESAIEVHRRMGSTPGGKHTGRSTHREKHERKKGQVQFW